jgi:hypothetical protein
MLIGRSDKPGASESRIWGISSQICLTQYHQGVKNYKIYTKAIS